MACANSVRQGLVSSDFCPQDTAVCWSFPGLESEAANRGNHPACLHTWRQSDTVTENKWSRLTSVYTREACRLRSSQLRVPCHLYNHSVLVWLMWRDRSQESEKHKKWNLLNAFGVVLPRTSTACWSLAYVSWGSWCMPIHLWGTASHSATSCSSHCSGVRSQDGSLSNRAARCVV